jgi:hypothetical protein
VILKEASIRVTLVRSVRVDAIAMANTEISSSHHGKQRLHESLTNRVSHLWVVAMMDMKTNPPV